MKKSALVVIENNSPITTSRIVAEKFDKPHNDVMKSIRRLITDLGGVGKISQTPMFNETTWTNEQNGQTYPMFTMTRDGFSLLAMGFTGKKALEFKIKFINEFNRMEDTLKKLADKQSLAWLETRQLVKATRRIFTSAVKALEMHFADKGNSFPPGYIYGHLTNVVQNALGIVKGSRDKQTIRKLNQLDQAEDVAANIILRGITDKTFATLAEVDALILLQLRKLNELLCGQLFLPDGGSDHAQD